MSRHFHRRGRVCHCSQLLSELVHRAYWAQPTLPSLVIEVDWLHDTLVICHVCQCWRVYDCGFFAFETLFVDARRMLEDFGFGTPRDLRWYCKF